MRIRSLILFDLENIVIHSNKKVLEFITLYNITNKTDINNLFIFYSLLEILEIYKNNKNVEILISNSYNNKLDVKKIGFITYSTKDKNRGHGLLLVNNIIKNNKTFENEKIITNDVFTQKLIVKK